ncbi:unnamed protein product [Rangifer tarandus platyrhynchus]|uniref:Secreted protein n=1 Tax=Rangifer tarandus platyrhynchus TaxID=3082113 RepID=A0ABN8YGZ8_RANTA|nr:unnamed protein product [Rangifer tarandus platyrhynchus]
MRHLLTEKVLTMWLALCPSRKWRPGLRCPRAGDMKARKPAAFFVELALGNVATAGCSLPQRQRARQSTRQSGERPSVPGAKATASPNASLVLQEVGRDRLAQSSGD